jgi:hypothetical protein
MSTAVVEETETTRRSANPIGAYLNAKERGDMAMAQHEDFFNDPEHVDRLAAVGTVLHDFFGRHPDYITPRGINRRRPFDNVKMNNVGWFLNRFSTADKQTRLYDRLSAIGNVEAISKNGHFWVRVY